MRHGSPAASSSPQRKQTNNQRAPFTCNAMCRLVVVGRSTCPFCIEVSRTLTEMGLPFLYFQGGCWAA